LRPQRQAHKRGLDFGPSLRQKIALPPGLDRCSPEIKPQAVTEAQGSRPNKNCCRGGNKSERGGVYPREVPDQGLPAATFEDLALPLFDQLYNFARWLTGDTAEAEDLVQETYAKALRGFASFQAGTNFRAWMYRILRNSFLSSRTGLKTRVPLDEEVQESPAVPDDSTPESWLACQAERETVQQALEELPVHFREILLLSEVEERSYQEMAETLAIPPGRVMSRLFRARKALRGRLQEKLGRARNAL
jgi:RNA polymerase sigma-70 factor, ECF subfamily